MYYGNDTSTHIFKEVWPVIFLNSCKRLDLKAMVRRISILLLRRSRKLSKSRTPLLTPVKKHYIWRQSNSNNELPSYLTLRANRFKIVLSDKVSFL